MAVTPLEAAAQRREIESIAEQVPSAPDLAKKQRDEREAHVRAQQDRQDRQFCVDRATQACAAGGYDVHDILRLTVGYYDFLCGRLIDTPATPERSERGRLERDSA